MISLGAFGKAYLLSVKASNNGKILEEICYEEEMVFNVRSGNSG